MTKNSEMVAEPTTNRRMAARRKIGAGQVVEQDIDVDEVVDEMKSDKSEQKYDGPDRRSGAKPVKVERRRQIDPTTCERDYNGEEIEFMRAMDDYKRRSGRQFPTWSEVLEVLVAMGYRRVAEPFDVLADKKDEE
ncbi:hypothetical protein [Calycomorphotria hydatis]|uniref:Uncharacterized protein n=1 Tax=Calycomorphotria hydatis TaxID=2528027 RepID=A0A517TAN6_9PLAN|nr:hypothetical protein [Calycomorphotria hydatis]QDT65433.1 hypothetical protein V22_26860 [Calycomorphotria hydatis]